MAIKQMDDQHSTPTRPPQALAKDYQRQVSWLVSLLPAFPELRTAPVARKGQQLGNETYSCGDSSGIAPDSLLSQWLPDGSMAP